MAVGIGPQALTASKSIDADQIFLSWGGRQVHCMMLRFAVQIHTEIAVNLCDIPVCLLVVPHHIRTPFYKPKHALGDLAGSQHDEANRGSAH